MVWKERNISDVYEARTAVADSRIELDGITKASCYSSSKGKYYEVEYDPETNSIMSNDNTAYYTDSVSYPMIALLMLKGTISYNEKLLEMLKDIYWKDINQRFKNDYDKAIEYVLTDLQVKGVDVGYVRSEVDKIYAVACNLRLNYLGEKIKPPVAY